VLFVFSVAHSFSCSFAGRANSDRNQRALVTVMAVMTVVMAPAHVMVMTRERGRRRQDEEGAEYENQLLQWSFL
jgi:hypothetical protein